MNDLQRIVDQLGMGLKATECEWSVNYPTYGLYITRCPDYFLFETTLVVCDYRGNYSNDFFIFSSISYDFQNKRRSTYLGDCTYSIKDYNTPDEVVERVAADRAKIVSKLLLP